MSTRTIVVANQKGGVAKTITSGAIASILSQKFGYKVLCIDMDPQANLTDNSDVEKNDMTDSVLRGKSLISENVQTAKSYDILAASISLAAMELELNGMMGREQRLKEAIASDPGMEKYDFIIIDTPPALGTLTVASLVAATDVLIPTMADSGSVNGIYQLGETIKSVRKYFNKDLRICGVLLTRFTPRYNISKQIKQVAEMLAETLDTKVFNTYIRQSVAAAEANYCRKSLISYDPKSAVSMDYEKLVEELLSDSMPETGGENHGE